MSLNFIFHLSDLLNTKKEVKEQKLAFNELMFVKNNI